MVRYEKLYLAEALLICLQYKKDYLQEMWKKPLMFSIKYPVSQKLAKNGGYCLRKMLYNEQADFLRLSHNVKTYTVLLYKWSFFKKCKLPKAFVLPSSSLYLKKH